MDVKVLLRRFVVILLGFLTGQFIVKVLSGPIVRPNRYIAIHDDRGISKIECLFYVVLGCVVGIAIMAFATRV